MTETRRAAFDRRQRRRSALVAAISTVLVVAVLVVLVPLAPGWDRVRAAFFDVDEFRSALPKLWKPFLLNIRIFVICTPLIMVVGMLVALARNVRSPALYPLRLFATLYTDVVRGVPVILWISLIGLGVPGLFQERAWYSKGIVWGSVALVMCYSAYVAEVFRSGIIGIHESQRAAARSLGLSSGQSMRSAGRTSSWRRRSTSPRWWRLLCCSCASASRSPDWPTTCWCARSGAARARRCADAPHRARAQVVR
jgi:polar amino acid transport system permease protein